MTFKKLALASAIAALPVATMAVDYLDDEMMSGVTGQDGIRVTLDLNVQTDIAVHDTSGIAGYAGTLDRDFTYTAPADTDASTSGVTVAGSLGANSTNANVAGIYYVGTLAAPAYPGDQAMNSGDAPLVIPGSSEAYDYENAGAIVIEGMGIVSSGMVIDIDAGNDAVSGSAPVLNVGVNIANGTVITTGAIRVANSNRDEDDDSDGFADWGYTNASGTIVESSTITLGNTLLNVQLANEPQGHMIRIDTDIVGSGNGAIRIANAAVRDLNGAPGSAVAGAIGADAVVIGNSGDANSLGVGVGIDVDATRGLVVTINQLGDAQGANIRVERAYLGSAALGYIGDLEMNRLQLSGTQIAISGK